MSQDQIDLNAVLQNELFQKRVRDLQHGSAVWFQENHHLIPPGLVRDFFLWAWDETKDHYPAFVKIPFLEQPLMYSAYNSIGVIEETHWAQYMQACCTGWIQYNFVEFLTDNLNLHYRDNLETDPALSQLQKDALISFNDAFISKINGDSTPTAELLIPFLGKINQMPLTDRHFDSPPLVAHIHIFLERATNGATFKEFKQDFGAFFAANIDFCLESLALIADRDGYAHAVHRYALRYAAINTFLTPNFSMTRSEVLTLRASEMMVSSSLLFFFLIVTKILGLSDRLSQGLKTGLVQRVIEGADILTRIANDLGGLVLATQLDIDEIFASICTFHLDHSTETTSIPGLFEAWFQNASRQFSVPTRRLARDMILGEENIARYYGCGTPPKTTLENLHYLQESVSHYAAVYRQTQGEFDQYLIQLTQVLGNPVCSDLANRFVVSMQQLYQSPFHYFE